MMKESNDSTKFQQDLDIKENYKKNYHRLNLERVKLVAKYGDEMMGVQRRCMVVFNKHNRLKYELLGGQVVNDDTCELMDELERTFKVCNDDTFRNVHNVVYNEKFLKFVEENVERMNMLILFIYAELELLRGISEAKRCGQEGIYSHDQKFILDGEDYVDVMGEKWCEKYVGLAEIVSLFLENLVW